MCLSCVGLGLGFDTKPGGRTATIGRLGLTFTKPHYGDGRPDVPISVVSAWAGHAVPAFTLRQYVYATPEGIAAAGATLGTVSEL